jgi:hypothetical protein
MTSAKESVPSVALGARNGADQDGAKGVLVARFGSFIMASAKDPEDEPEQSFAATLKEVVRQIRADSRVLSVTEPRIEEEWCSSGDLFPSPTHEHAAGAHIGAGVAVVRRARAEREDRHDHDERDDQPDEDHQRHLRGALEAPRSGSGPCPTGF